MIFTFFDHVRVAFIVCAGLFGTICQANPSPFLVKTAEELVQAVKDAKPGAAIALADGRYKNFQVSLVGRGSEDKPVLIRAQTQGKVVLTGESSVEVDGTWLVLSGFVFRDGNPPSAQSAKDTSASAIKLRGTHNRVTETAIVDYSLNYKSPPNTDPTRASYHKWIGIWGQYNRIDHSHFQGKKGGGTLLTVWRDTSAPNHHQIDHNAFIDVAHGNDENGWETIRLGDSTQSQSNSNTVVEHNYFDRCNGEIEIISNKSGGNTYRYNTFNNSRGTLTLRHGSGATVNNNVFLIDDKSYGGGIRVSDKNHIIRNNYIEGVRGFSPHWGGVVLLAHSTNAPLNDYWPVENVLIENNAVINSTNSVVIGAGRAAQSPVSATFRNNVLCNKPGNASESSLINRVPSKTGKLSLVFEGNVLCGASPGLPATELGDSIFSADCLKKTDSFWLLNAKGRGFQPFQKTSLADVGPRGFTPYSNSQ
jgi:poly(beta-D-mannuronate) lyase